MRQGIDFQVLGAFSNELHCTKLEMTCKFLSKVSIPARQAAQVTAHAFRFVVVNGWDKLFFSI